MELAKVFNGKIILTSAWQQVPVTVTEPLVLVAPDICALVMEKLKTEADHLNSLNAMPVEILAKEGPAPHAILTAAKERNADLIIAGMKGSGKATRKFFGSTVTSLAGKTTVPILVIPEGTGYKSPRAIALANDISPQAGTHLLDVLRSLLEKFHSTLYIVRIITKRSDEVIEILNRPSNLDKMLENLSPLYEFPLDRNITKALNNFVSTHRVDMLVMIPHRESLPEKWFLRSNTREMLFKTNIPMLILPDLPHRKHTHSIIF
jgi:nucleotide-binding universal stress UspA family protein